MEFHHRIYQPGKEPCSQMDALLHITRWWLQLEQLTVVEIVKRVTFKRFLRALPSEERKAVGINAITTPKVMITALECPLATLYMGRGERREKSLDWWHEFSKCPGMPTMSPAWAQEELQIRPLSMDADQVRTPTTSLSCQTMADTLLLASLLAYFTAPYPNHHILTEWISVSCTPRFGALHYTGSTLSPLPVCEALWQPHSNMCTWGHTGGPSGQVKSRHHPR